MAEYYRSFLPKSTYFRLIEHQKKLKLRTYAPDYPLVFFITFSRVASGISLLSIFFPLSLFWAALPFGFMILATLASIVHLKVPHRFLTMIRNNRSSLVWEVRLAGAFTTGLGLHLLSFFGYLKGFHPIFPWINFIIALLFLVSTGWAYWFETHPAWKTWILPVYYVASAVMTGLIFHSIDHSVRMLSLFYPILLFSKGFLLFLYRDHLKKTSPTSLDNMRGGDERWPFLSFLWFAFLFPALLTIHLLVNGTLGNLSLLLAMSDFIGILIERILFFRVERPIFFLSFIENPNGKGSYWIRG